MGDLLPWATKDDVTVTELVVAPLPIPDVTDPLSMPIPSLPPVVNSPDATSQLPSSIPIHSPPSVVNSLPIPDVTPHHSPSSIPVPSLSPAGNSSPPIPNATSLVRIAPPKSPSPEPVMCVKFPSSKLKCFSSPPHTLPFVSASPFSIPGTKPKPHKPKPDAPPNPDPWPEPRHPKLMDPEPKLPKPNSKQKPSKPRPEHTQSPEPKPEPKFPEPNTLSPPPPPPPPPPHDPHIWPVCKPRGDGYAKKILPLHGEVTLVLKSRRKIARVIIATPQNADVYSDSSIKSIVRFKHADSRCPGTDTDRLKELDKKIEELEGMAVERAHEMVREAKERAKEKRRTKQDIAEKDGGGMKVRHHQDKPRIQKEPSLYFPWL